MYLTNRMIAVMRMRMRSPLLRLRTARTKQRASTFNIILASIKKYNNFALQLFSVFHGVLASSVAIRAVHP